jgi:hypothetical protein
MLIIKYFARFIFHVFSRKVLIVALIIISLLIISTQNLVLNDSEQDLIIDTEVTTVHNSIEDSLAGSRARANIDFIITTENNSHITNGKEATGYFINITNTGTLQDTVVLSVEIINVTGGDEPDVREWSAVLDKTQVTVPPGVSAMVVLTVVSSCGCQEGTVATIRVNGRSITEPSISGFLDTYTTRGPSLDGDLLEVELADVSVFMDLQAGKSITFELNIYNLQSIEQSYIVSTFYRPVGWKLDYLRTSFIVGGKAKYTMDVELTLPIQNEPGDYKIIFDIESDWDSNIEDGLEIPLKLLPELAVEAIKLVGDNVYPGENVTVQVIIKNLGQAIARGFKVNLYNTTNIQDQPEDHIIGSVVFPSIGAGAEQVLNFTWRPDAVGEENLTAHVNPNSAIPEFSNRYGNNILTKKVAVHEPGSNDPGDKDDDSGSGIGYLIPTISLIIVIIIILFLIYYAKHRSSGGGSSTRTARKIPLDQRGRGVAKAKSGKKARKEKI